MERDHGAGGFLISSVRYSTMVHIGDRPMEVPNFVNGVQDGMRVIETPIFQTVTEVMPGTWQLVVAVMLFMLVAGAIRVTQSIWEHQADAQAAAVSSRKMKREQEARMRRLLARMDDEERLAALEAERIGDDGKRVSMAELLQSRRG